MTTTYKVKVETVNGQTESQTFAEYADAKQFGVQQANRTEAKSVDAFVIYPDGTEEWTAMFHLGGRDR